MHRSEERRDVNLINPAIIKHSKEMHKQFILLVLDQQMLLKAIMFSPYSAFFLQIDSSKNWDAYCRNAKDESETKYND